MKKAKTIRAKSVKSVSLKRKSLEKPNDAQDEHFWPRFTPNFLKSFQSDNASGNKTAETERYREKVISLPLCMQKVLSSHVSPSFIASGSDKVVIFASSSLFDLESLHTGPNSIIYSKTINAFDILLTNPHTFTDDAEFNKWTPSNHIYYGDGGASSDDGKYLIRVFHANYWRAITVDDQLPVDSDKQILLPHYYDSSENKLQLWPVLLTKAFLKLNQAKQVTEQRERHCPCKQQRKVSDKSFFVSLDPITMLTGWHGTEYNLLKLHHFEKWKTILGTFEQMKNNELVVLCVCKANDDGEEQRQTMQMLDIRYYPFVEPEPLDSWKLHRWKDWAIDKGLYKNDKDCNGILVCISKGKQNFIKDFIDEDKYTGVKASISRETVIMKTESNVSNKRRSSRKRSTIVNNVVTESCIKYWLKFDKIAKFLETIKIYHKPDSFVNNFKLSSEDAPSDTLKYLPDGTRPLFLITENAEDHALLHVTLSTMRNNDEKSRKFSSLIIGHYYWHDTTNDKNILAQLVAYHDVTTTIALPKGRHVYRLNLLADHYSALFQSNCDFKLVQEREMWVFLQTECLSMQKCGDAIAGIFSNLTQNFGTKTFKDNERELRKFLLSLFTVEWTQIKAAQSFAWQTFLQKFIELLYGLGDKEAARVVKIMFLFPNFTSSCLAYGHHKQIAREMCGVYGKLRRRKCPCSEDGNIFDDCYVGQVEDYAATVIISWFKMLSVKNLVKYHKSMDLMKQFIGTLKQFYEQYFENDKSKIYDLIRSFTSHLLCGGSLSTLYTDLDNAIHTLEYTGVATERSDGMSLLACTLSLTCHSRVPEKYSIRLAGSADLHAYIPFVKIIDEDTNCPVEDTTANVYMLMQNHHGYTLYAYFWSNGDDNPSQMPMSWNIEISFRKHVAPLHACVRVLHEDDNGRLSGCHLINTNEMTRIEHQGNYKKYFNNKLCRFYGLLESNNKDICLNLFFKCYKNTKTEDVRVMLRFLDKENRILHTKETINGEIIEIGCKLRSFFVLECSLLHEETLEIHDIVRWNIKIYFPKTFQEFSFKYDDARDSADAKLRATWRENDVIARGKLLRESLLQNSSDLRSSSGSTIQSHLLSSHSLNSNYVNLGVFSRRLAGYTNEL